MSKEGMQEVISKAVSDTKFREAFFANPDKALHGFVLTEDEIAALKRIDAESMQSLAGSLDERISKAVIIGITIGGFGGRRVKAEGGLLRPRRRIGGALK